MDCKRFSPPDWEGRSKGVAIFFLCFGPPVAHHACCHLSAAPD